MSLNFYFIKLNDQAVKLIKLNFRMVNLNANMVNVNKKSYKIIKSLIIIPFTICKSIQLKSVACSRHKRLAEILWNIFRFKLSIILVKLHTNRWPENMGEGDLARTISHQFWANCKNSSEIFHEDSFFLKFNVFENLAKRHAQRLPFLNVTSRQAKKWRSAASGQISIVNWLITCKIGNINPSAIHTAQFIEFHSPKHRKHRERNGQQPVQEMSVNLMHF